MPGLFWFRDELLWSVECCLKFWKAKGAGGAVAEDQVRSVTTCAVRGSLASTWLQALRPRSTLLVFLDAFESFFKLCDQRSLTRLEAVPAHDAPEIIAACLVPVVESQHIF